MNLRMLKSKLHLATVTDTELDYHGSVTIAEDLMEAVGLRAHEALLIANATTGQRAESYVLRGARGSGRICMNGALARLAQPGDRVILMAFAYVDAAEADGLQARVAILDHENRIVEQWSGERDESSKDRIPSDATRPPR